MLVLSRSPWAALVSKQALSAMPAERKIASAGWLAVTATQVSIFWEEQIVVEYCCKQHFWSHVMCSCALGMHPASFMTHHDTVPHAWHVHACTARMNAWPPRLHTDFRLIIDQYSIPHSSMY